MRYDGANGNPASLHHFIRTQRKELPVKTRFPLLVYLHLPRLAVTLPRLLVIVAAALALLGAVEYSLVGAQGPLHLLADGGLDGSGKDVCPPGIVDACTGG